MAVDKMEDDLRFDCVQPTGAYNMCMVAVDNTKVIWRGQARNHQATAKEAEQETVRRGATVTLAQLSGKGAVTVAALLSTGARVVCRFETGVDGVGSDGVNHSETLCCLLGVGSYVREGIAVDSGF